MTLKDLANGADPNRPAADYSTFLDLAQMGDPETLFHEHDGVHPGRLVTAAGKSVADDFDSNLAGYYALGFECKARTKEEVVFLQNGDKRIELMAKEFAPEHVAFAVRKRHEVDAWRRRLAKDRCFDLLKDSSDDELRHILCRFKPTGTVLQILWRPKQIFDGVFSAHRCESEPLEMDVSELTEEVR
jgi:hypothetical protein